MPRDTVTGIDLARDYFSDVVAPIVSSLFPALRYAAGRLGPGSDVLGFDDAVSQDHDWGLRLNLFVPDDVVTTARRALEDRLPQTYRGRPTRFVLTGESGSRHHVEVGTVAGFVIDRLGFDPRLGLRVHDWLSLSGQSVLEVVAGPVFTDRAGELEAARRRLDWYPDGIWRHVLACDWDRIGLELPLMGRAADVGDEIGSRIIAARLAEVVIHLAFMLEREWPPYPKWRGVRFGQLPCADRVAVAAMVGGRDAGARQRSIADALQMLLEQQNALGLTSVNSALIPFWDRPYLHPDPAIAAELVDGISDPEVRRLPPGRGSIEQRTGNVRVLMDPSARRHAVVD